MMRGVAHAEKSIDVEAPSTAPLVFGRAFRL